MAVSLVLQATNPQERPMAAMLLLFCFCRPQIVQTTRSPNPVRRPSGGAVERSVWHGCQTRTDGPGMALRDDPRNSAGAREVWRSQTRMPGVLSLWLLSLCTSKEKVTRRKGETLTPRHRCCGGKPAVNRRKPEQQVGWMTLYPSTTAVVARATVLLLGQIQLVIVLNKLEQDVV